MRSPAWSRAAQCLTHGGDHVAGPWIVRMLERGAGRSGRIGKRHSANRRLEFVENVFGDEGSDLGSSAAGPPGGVRDHQAASLGDRFEDQALVQWAQGSRIDNLRLDAVI